MAPDPASGAASMTVETVLRASAGGLRAAGIDTPEVDARLLLAAALGASKLELIANPDRRLSDEEAARFGTHLIRRMNREPVSRILGRRDFYGREFLISPATLDPRPDTETLIELALEIADEQAWRSRPIRIVDIGTGSGCILLTLLAALPLATGVGTDIDPAALKIAAANASKLQIDQRVSFKVARSLVGVDGPFDLLVSNPPYIPTAAISGLDPEVRHYDPSHALDGGADGFAIISEIAQGLYCAVPNGCALFEVGAGQAENALKILQSENMKKCRIKRDLGGHDRVVAVWTQS